MIKIAVPVHVRNQEASPGMKRGGALNINLHELELMVPADQIPEEVVIDLTGLEIGASVRGFDVKLPAGAQLTAHHRDATVASVATSSAMQSADASAEGGAS